VYLVTNKNKNSQPELYPSFIVDGLLTKAKSDKRYFVKPLEDGLEIQTKTLWLTIKKVEFPASTEQR
jgi:hypothetical protein